MFIVIVHQRLRKFTFLPLQHQRVEVGGVQFIALQRSHSQGCTTTFKLVFASYTPEDRTGLMFLALRWFPVISISHRNLILRY